MKRFLTTTVLMCLTVIVWGQTLDKVPGYKSPFSRANARVSNHTLPGGPIGKLSASQAANAGRVEVPVMSVIPTLKLWMLPAAVPNPFVKDEE